VAGSKAERREWGRANGVASTKTKEAKNHRAVRGGDLGNKEKNAAWSLDEWRRTHRKNNERTTAEEQRRWPRLRENAGSILCEDLQRNYLKLFIKAQKVTAVLVAISGKTLPASKMGRYKTKRILVKKPKKPVGGL